MYKLIAVIALSLCARAQSIIPTVSPSTVVAGKTTTVTLTYTAGSTPAAGLQWTDTLPPSSTVVWTISAAATANGKQLDCNATGTTCLLFGLNQTAISAGVIATGVLTIPNKGSQTFTVTSALGADPNGISIAVGAGAIGILGTSIYDLNGDGLVNISDLVIAAQQSVGTCTTADFNGDGKCNIIDLLLLVVDSLSGNP